MSRKVQKGNIAVATRGSKPQNELGSKARAAVFDVVASSGICSKGELDEVVETRVQEPTALLIKPP
jgi:hypothetical protein